MPRSQVVLRAVVLLGPMVAMLATGPAGHWAPWWLLLPVAALAAAGAVAPDTPIVAGAGLAVLVWWSVGLDAGAPAWALLAAAALVAGHVAALLAAYGPASMPVDRATVLVWVRRGVVVLLAAPGAWLVVRALRGEPEQPGVWILGVAAAFVATVVATLALEVRSRP